MATLIGLVGIRLSPLWLFVHGGLLGVGPAEYYARRGHIDQSLARAGAGMSGAMRPVWNWFEYGRTYFAISRASWPSIDQLIARGAGARPDHRRQSGRPTGIAKADMRMLKFHQ